MYVCMYVYIYIYIYMCMCMLCSRLRESRYRSFFLSFSVRTHVSYFYYTRYTSRKTLYTDDKTRPDVKFRLIASLCLSCVVLHNIIAQPSDTLSHAFDYTNRRGHFHASHDRLPDSHSLTDRSIDHRQIS